LATVAATSVANGKAIDRSNRSIQEVGRLTVIENDVN
jgi:hypothetical protein